MHLVRRNVDCTYLIEDNGTYGLTKGQFSATADIGSTQKRGAVNTYRPIDPCAVALTLGCSFVARSFSGDGKQLVPLLKAAIAHRGMALIDIVSPCVTFNDHDGSTKSYSWVKDHDEQIQDVSFIPYFEEIEVDYEPGETTVVELHDGSHLRLRSWARTTTAPTASVRCLWSSGPGTRASGDRAARRRRVGRPTSRPPRSSPNVRCTSSVRKTSGPRREAFAALMAEIA